MFQYVSCMCLFDVVVTEKYKMRFGCALRVKMARVNMNETSVLTHSNPKMTRVIQTSDLSTKQ